MATVQTVTQARIETSSPNSRKPTGLDERVLPDLKASIKNADSESKQRARYRKQGVRREVDPRRQSRGTLRSLWNVLSRNNELERNGGAQASAAEVGPSSLSSSPAFVDSDLPVSISIPFFSGLQICAICP